MFDKKYYFEKLEKAVAYHGHLCSGQAIGVKMALYAIELLNLGVKDDYKNLKVYVETDRCIADSIMTVTGCKVGKRRFVLLDYGKTACTFVNMDNKEAYRIYRKNRLFPPDGGDIAEFFADLKNEDLFVAKKVLVDIRSEDMPGKPIGAAFCQLCGEEVIDLKEVVKDGKTMCKNCANKSYYKEI
jgi:formylmethanofuran dehydrogenase, subunit E region